jgi:protein farnesyltransferase/geranylgeranyltransferase type-1 subunit alpha
VLGKANLPLSTIEKLCTNYAPLENPDKVTSSHALELLADICEEKGNVEGATRAFGLLAEKYDPIRANYWAWRKAGLSKK